MGSLMLLGDFLFQQANAEKSSESRTKTKSSFAEWYIVLVSVPVMDNVLPLKHLAEELLYRGYRVGFALPEV